MDRRFGNWTELSRLRSKQFIDQAGGITEELGLNAAAAQSGKPQVAEWRLLVVHHQVTSVLETGHMELGPVFGRTGTDSVANLVRRADKRQQQSESWRKASREIEAALHLKTEHKA